MILKKLGLTALLALSIALTGCSSNQKKGGSDGENMASAESLNLELNSDSDSGKAGAIQSVYFPFNSSMLTGQTKAALDGNVEFLKANPSVEVQVEGHCDERGGVQFNLALGEGRANAVKRYLVTMGVDSSRITTISFGKERPIAFGHDEESWSQNRRANFVITAK